MALTKLALYNGALSLYTGQRRLSAIDEERPARYDLDTAYDFNAVQFCMETVKPVFARDTYVSTSSSQDSDHGSSYLHTLPSEYITLVRAYSDITLDTPIDRYRIEGNVFVCDYSTVYLRFISNAYLETYTYWSQAFANVVSAYLAVQISTKIAPDEHEGLVSMFIEAVKIAKELDLQLEPERRPSQTTGALSNTWKKIYNDALFIVGLEEITSNTDDSNRRIKLDHVLATDLVAELLEDVGWNFAMFSAMSTYDSGLEPEWGYSRVHPIPDDYHRVYGVFLDENMKMPLKDYYEEKGKIFCEYDTIYLQYVSSSWVNTPDNWPSFFKKLVAARMAKDVAASIEGADAERANATYQDRRNSALSNNVVMSPPRRIAGGSWVGARGSGRSTYRGRP